LYFANRTSVKRINLKGDIKIETIIGTEEQKDILGNFETARFSNINCFNIDAQDNIFILDLGGSKIKRANLTTREVETIKFDTAGSAHTYGAPAIDTVEPDLIIQGDIKKIQVNPKNNQLYFIVSSTFTSNIFQLNLKNQIVDLKLTVGYPNSFTFDNEGNMYVISISDEKLLKVSPENKTEEISGFWGALTIKKDYNFNEMGYLPHTNLVIDNRKKILYMSSESDNKIFKLKL
jgi:hypothetical protein